MSDQAKRAVIFGITGQDGSYLAEFLLHKGYEVFGVVRPRSTGVDASNLAALEGHERIWLRTGDVTDEDSVRRTLQTVQPHEIYNLAAVSFVAQSWRSLDLVMQTNAMGAVHVFRAARDYCPKARIYQASSSEQFGNAEPPQTELTPMRPVSPYGVAKLTAHAMASVFRLSYGLFVACGICFNHESERRGQAFVSRKIARGVAEIVRGVADTLTLGDLTPSRDWGYAPDYVEAMWLMLQQDMPDDFVIATGRSRSVREMVQAAFAHVNLFDWQPYVREDPDLTRPVEVRRLVGYARKAQRVLGWQPTVTFEQMVGRMVDAEIAALEATT